MTAEEAILACMLTDEIAAREGSSRLMASDFVLPAHIRIFTAICEDILAGILPDIVTVTRRCKQDAVQIMDLSSSISSTANYKEYIQAVIEESSLRKLKAMGVDLQNSIDINQAADDVAHELTGIHNRMLAADDYSARASVELAIKSFMDRAAGTNPGIDTPVHKLTTITGGWQSSDLIIIAARPSIGKTAFAIACMNTAISQSKSVIFFSLEMSRERIMDRMIIGRAGVDALYYRAGSLPDESYMRVKEAAAYYREAPLWIYDKGMVGIGEVEAFCLTKKKEGQCDMVIIDYIQLMQTRQIKGRTRDGELAELSRSLKMLAKELNVPVIVLSQLNREVEKRSNKRPILADLRESGAIEQDADIVLMLYRAAYYGEQSVKIGNGEISSLGIGEVIIAKHRNGETGIEYWTHNDSLTRIGGYPSIEFEYQSYGN